MEGEFETKLVLAKEAKRLQKRGYETRWRKQSKNGRYLLLKREK